MLRISQVDAGNQLVVLRLEGRVAGPWVSELSEACANLLRQGRHLRLDLGEVSFVDSSGVTLISGLKALGISLDECSPFVAEQLKSR